MKNRIIAAVIFIIISAWFTYAQAYDQFSDRYSQQYSSGSINSPVGDRSSQYSTTNINNPFNPYNPDNQRRTYYTPRIIANPPQNNYYSSTLASSGQSQKVIQPDPSVKSDEALNFLDKAGAKQSSPVPFYLFVLVFLAVGLTALIIMGTFKK